MMTLREFQSRFQAAVFSGDEDVCGSILDDGIPAVRRVQIHRNNTFITLTEALEAIFPAVGRLVGEDFFAFAARRYILESPPRSGTLIEFGNGFPRFLESFAPANGLVYLADVARLEWLWHESFHALEAVPLDGERLAATPPDRLDRIRFVFHPSLRLLSSRYPVLRIWQANVGEAGSPDRIDLSESSDRVQIARPQADVEVRRLPDDAFEFLNALANGGTIGSAYAETLKDHPEFNPSEALRHLVVSGMAIDFAIDQDGTGEQEGGVDQ